MSGDNGDKDARALTSDDVSDGGDVGVCEMSVVSE